MITMKVYLMLWQNIWWFSVNHCGNETRQLQTICYTETFALVGIGLHWVALSTSWVKTQQLHKISKKTWTTDIDNLFCIKKLLTQSK